MIRSIGSIGVVVAGVVGASGVGSGGVVMSGLVGASGVIGSDRESWVPP